jgi:hypothetical protein
VNIPLLFQNFMKLFSMCYVFLLYVSAFLLWRLCFNISSVFFSFFFCTLHIEPPSFVKKVDPSYLMLPGESARLHCKLKGSPVIQVTWFKNNKELSESNTVRMSFVNSEAILDITDVKVEDSGTYSCEAVNDVGSDSCSTEIVIKGLFMSYSPFCFSEKMFFFNCW